ncbi:MAG: hypothetical protein AB7I19_09370 [Planctomycetota bacterium]
MPVGVSISATVALDVDGDLRDDIAMLGTDGGIRIAHDPGIMTGFSNFRPVVTYTGVAAVARVNPGDPEYLITADVTNGLAGHHLVGSGVVTTLAPDNTWAGFGGLVVKHLAGTTQSLIAGFLPGTKTIRVARYVHGLGFLNLTTFDAMGPVLALGVVNWDAGTVPEIAVLSSGKLQICNLAGGTLVSFPSAGSPGSIVAPDDKSIAWIQPIDANGTHRVRLLRQAGAVFDQTMTLAVTSVPGGPSVFVSVDATASADLDGDGVADLALGQNDVPDVLMLRGIGDLDSGALIGFDSTLVVDRRVGISTNPSAAIAPTIGQFDNHYSFSGVTTLRYGVDGVPLSLDVDPKVADMVQHNLGNLPWGIYAEENLSFPNWRGSTSELELRLMIPGWILQGMTHLEADLWKIEGTHSGGAVTVNHVGLGVQSWTLHTSNDPNLNVHNLHSALLSTTAPFVGETWSTSLTNRPHLLAFVRVVKRNAGSGALEVAQPSFMMVVAMGLNDNAEQNDPAYNDFLDILPPLYPGLPQTECIFDAERLPPPWPPIGVRKHIAKMKLPLPVPPPIPTGTVPVQGSSGTSTGTTSNQ